MKHSIVFLSLACTFFCAQATSAVIVPPMSSIPAGTFMMGSTEPSIGDGSHNPAEGPVHAVRINAFRMAKYETTVAQFRQFVAATGHKTQDSCWEFDGKDGIALKQVKWDAPRHAPGEYHPVMCVNWNDATAYVQWLSQQTGRQFRLPSEAEWEYAARAGTNAKFPSGDAPDTLCNYANMKDRRFRVAAQRDHGLDMLVTDCDDGVEYTTVVGMYQPNAFGLHDVMGNVAEWVADCEHANYQGAPTDGSAWNRDCKNDDGEDYLITRGGSYSSSRQVMRSAARGHGGRANASSLGEGFRIAEDIGGCGDGRCGVADAAFMAGLAAAQKAERDRRAAAKQGASGDGLK